MSGIHERRKGVDFDEDTLQAFDAELARLGGGPSIGPIPATPVAQDAPGQSSSPLKPPPDVTLSDSLLAGCRQCNWTPDPDMMIFFGGSEQARGAEEFRSLRSQLYRARKGQQLKSILVASALPKEGRSFVAANLAQVLTLQAGCRVLLIDADLRGGRLHSIFGTAATPGLSEYLLQETEEFAIIQRGAAKGLFFVPAGRKVQGQTELVANGRLQSLIDQVEPLFDWIIIDSPAAVPVTDAGLLANYCDGVLLVVRSHSTPFDVVRRARERFREESLVGVVLNKIETKPSPRNVRYTASTL
jgi:protein-tyrosine kinase